MWPVIATYCKPSPTTNLCFRLLSMATGRVCMYHVTHTHAPADYSVGQVKMDCRTLKEEPSLLLSAYSYLFPDGRSYNPDLTGLCEPMPHDHIKVTQVSVCICKYRHKHTVQSLSRILFLLQKDMIHMLWNFYNIWRSCWIFFYCLRLKYY